VRSAPFIVLIGANMPSVLAEVGFISNPRDERALRRDSGRQQLVAALFAGIEGYMKTLGRDVAQR
jgi:N-acetylmuramoyl-L-alanine amidase